MAFDSKSIGKKVRLFSEGATVAAFSLAQEAYIELTANGVTTRQEFKPGDLQKAFLLALDQKGMKYEVINRDELTLIFAVARDKYSEIQETMREFFTGERGWALTGSSTMQTFNESFMGQLKGKLLSLVDGERRDIAKTVARLNMG